MAETVTGGSMQNIPEGYGRTTLPIRAENLPAPPGMES